MQRRPRRRALRQGPPPARSRRSSPTTAPAVTARTAAAGARRRSTARTTSTGSRRRSRVAATGCRPSPGSCRPARSTLWRSTWQAACSRPCDIMRAMTSARASTPRSIRPAGPGLDARVRVPGSKSVTNRALLLAGLATGRSVLRGALDADDANAFAGGLRSLGVAVERQGDDLVVDGAGGPLPGGTRPTSSAPRRAPRPGSSLPRPRPARASYRFDAAPQLRRRPLGLLLQALRAQGARMEPDGAAGLPLTLLARGLAGGSLRLPGDTSSQFISALLLAAPLGRGPLDLRVDGLVSRPYVAMTLRMMEQFGAGAQTAADDHYVVDARDLRRPRLRRRAGRLHGVLLLRRRGHRRGRPGPRTAPGRRPAGRRRVPRRARVHGLHVDDEPDGRASGRPGCAGRPHRRHGRHLRHLHDARRHRAAGDLPRDHHRDRQRPPQGVGPHRRDGGEPAPGRRQDRVRRRLAARVPLHRRTGP